MKRALLVLGAVSILLPSMAASAAPPMQGEFVPGKDLARVTLGMTPKQVLETWGERHGVCRKCLDRTWYFNYRKFTPQGTGVVFRRGRVVHVFTVWRPAGWQSPEGLILGAPVSEVARRYGSLDRRDCTSYYALLKPTKGAESVFYIFRDHVWGFGLTLPNASPCL